jgi:ABC-type uncharacterized transport system fused permease/ATPase subunit
MRSRARIYAGSSTNSWFGVIASGLLVLNVTQAWLNQTTKVKLREWLVCDLFDEWLKPRRAFHLVNAGEMGTNPISASRGRAT